MINKAAKAVNEITRSVFEKEKEIFHIKGNDMVITKQDEVVNNIKTCDMFGWLIPKEKASDFEKIWKDGQEDDNGLKIIFD